MENFLSIEKNGNKAELIIDISLFSKDIIFKTAFLFLDKLYVFLKKKTKSSICVQFILKEDSKENLENIIGDFSNELLNNSLRQKLFEENKEIRTKIINSALENSLREAELPSTWK